VGSVLNDDYLERSLLVTWFWRADLFSWIPNYNDKGDQELFIVRSRSRESVWAHPQYAVVWAWKSKKYRIINTIFPYIPKCIVHSSNTDTWTRKRIVEWFLDIVSSFLFCSIQYVLMSMYQMLRYLFWTLQSTAFWVGHIGSRLPSAFAGYTTWTYYHYHCCHCFMFYSIYW
jgi:hypothetical protein